MSDVLLGEVTLPAATYTTLYTPGAGVSALVECAVANSETTVVITADIYIALANPPEPGATHYSAVIGVGGAFAQAGLVVANPYLLVVRTSGTAVATAIGEEGANLTALPRGPVKLYRNTTQLERPYPAYVGTGGAGGSVTSVGLSMPAEFAVANSPVIDNATLVVTKATQNANRAWMGPTAGPAAAPTFRALVAADLPATYVRLQAGSPTFADPGSIEVSNTIVADVMIGAGVLPSAPLCVKDDGTKCVRLYGATSGYLGLRPAAVAGAVTYTWPATDGANDQVLTTNGAGVLSWSDKGGGGGGGGGITTLNGQVGAVQTFSGSGGIVITSVGNNHDIAFGAGVLTVPNGGTGAATLTGIVHGNGVAAFTAGPVALATEVSGLLPIANGGTNAGTAADARTNLGLGTMATQNANAVTITGGTLAGMTSVAATTFTGALTGNVTGNVSGNAGTVTNGVYTTGSYANPAWITSLAWAKITGVPPAGPDPVMTGATAGAAGTEGDVPQPLAGQQNKFLRGDATWASPNTYEVWVADYGTDCAAIQTAITAAPTGAIVHLEARTYAKKGSAISVTKPLKIVGVGNTVTYATDGTGGATTFQGTTLVNDGAYDTIAVNIDSTATAPAYADGGNTGIGVLIEGISFKMAAGLSTGVSITGTNANENTVIYRCGFYQGAYGVRAIKARSMRVDSCQFSDTRSAAVYGTSNWTDDGRWWIVNNDVKTNYGYAFYIINTSAVTIQGNHTIGANTALAVQYTSGNGCVQYEIIGNQLTTYGAAGQPILFTSAVAGGAGAFINIVGNSLDCDLSGANTRGVVEFTSGGGTWSNITISANSFRKQSTGGGLIKVDHVTGMSVTGNVFDFGGSVDATRYVFYGGASLNGILVGPNQFMNSGVTAPFQGSGYVVHQPTSQGSSAGFLVANLPTLGVAGVGSMIYATNALGGAGAATPGGSGTLCFYRPDGGGGYAWYSL